MQMRSASPLPLFGEVLLPLPLSPLLGEVLLPLPLSPLWGEMPKVEGGLGQSSLAPDLIHPDTDGTLSVTA